MSQATTNFELERESRYTFAAAHESVFRCRQECGPRFGNSRCRQPLSLFEGAFPRTPADFSRTLGVSGLRKGTRRGGESPGQR